MAINIDEIISISGTSGLYTMVSNKKNGLILEDISTKKKRFYPAMRYQFTPLSSISIYTTRDTIPLENVFRNMMQQYEDNPPIEVSSLKEEVEEYFLDIIPDYDVKKVFHSDMKKIIKWFNFLKENNIISLDDDPLAHTEEE